MPAPKYPPVPPGVTRVTATTAETYLRCGIRVELEREEKHRRATVPMAIGSAVSVAASADIRNMLQREGRALPPAEVVERAVVAYEAEVSECEVDASPLEIGGGKDSAASAGRTYALDVSPNLPQPVVASEEPIVAPVSEGLELAGTPDIVTHLGIGDIKTGRERRQDEADRSRQLSFYALLHFHKYGSLPRRVWLDSIHPGKNALAKRYSSTRLWSHRGIEDLGRTIRLIEHVRKGMEAGIALPPPELGAWWCSAKWCPHWGRDCPLMGHMPRKEG